SRSSSQNLILEMDNDGAILTRPKTRARRAIAHPQSGEPELDLDRLGRQRCEVQSQSAISCGSEGHDVHCSSRYLAEGASRRQTICMVRLGRAEHPDKGAREPCGHLHAQAAGITTDGRAADCIAENGLATLAAGKVGVPDVVHGPRENGCLVGWTAFKGPRERGVRAVQISNFDQ